MKFVLRRLLSRYFTTFFYPISVAIFTFHIYSLFSAISNFTVIKVPSQLAAYIDSLSKRWGKRKYGDGDRNTRIHTPKIFIFEEQLPSLYAVTSKEVASCTSRTPRGYPLELPFIVPMLRVDSNLASSVRVNPSTPSGLQGFR